MKICVYGSTLTAWVAAACLAKVGNEVILHEGEVAGNKNLQDISVIRDELGLLEEISQQMKCQRLKRISHVDGCSASIHWLALEAGDQLRVEQLIDVIANTEQPRLVINQCNFEVGATAALQDRLTQHNCQTLMAYIPDNLEQGSALQGFMQPKRVIIGVDNDNALTLTKGLLKPFSKEMVIMQIMASKEAEFTKFATTGMLAIRLGYINELADLADKLCVDIDIIREGMGADPRIGRHYLSPGCGFGGQNFHNYIAMFSDIFEDKGSQSLLKTVIEENEAQKELLFRKFWQYCNGDLANKKVAIWGVSFKSGTASIDNAPSLRIIDALLSQGVQVNLHDPEALNNIKAHYKTNSLVTYHDDMYVAVENCDALLLVTEWSQYMSPDYSDLFKLLKHPLIIDGRNIFDKELLQQHGINYVGVGR